MLKKDVLFVKHIQKMLQYKKYTSVKWRTMPYKMSYMLQSFYDRLLFTNLLFSLFLKILKNIVYIMISNYHIGVYCADYIY